MDILCPICAEPWDQDTLHDVEGMSYRRAWSRFKKLGCETFGSKHGDGRAPEGLAELYDLLGDDVDGVASTLDDLGLT